MTRLKLTSQISFFSGLRGNQFSFWLNLSSKLCLFYGPVPAIRLESNKLSSAGRLLSSLTSGEERGASQVLPFIYLTSSPAGVEAGSVSQLPAPHSDSSLTAHESSRSNILAVPGSCHLLRKPVSGVSGKTNLCDSNYFVNSQVVQT